MKANSIVLPLLAMLIFTNCVHAQSTADITGKKIVKKYQAKAPPTQPIGANAVAPSDQTTMRWLGMDGFFVNSRGTTFMIDPLLEGYDMPIVIDFPILAKDVPHLDAVLVTHSDNDHYSVETCRDIKPVTTAYHSTIYVDSLMKNDGLPSLGHGIGDTFHIGAVQVKLTPADHAWQNAYPGTSTRFFKPEDACGFWMETPDGSIWAPGDSRLMAEHLHMQHPMLFYWTIQKTVPGISDWKAP